MKRLAYFCAAAFALVACTNDIMETQGPSTKEGITLEGSFGWTAPTKTAFTDAEAPTNTLVWSKGDAIGIFTLSGTTANINYKANLLRTTIGKTNGVFIPEEVTPAEGGEGESGEAQGLQIPDTGVDNFLIYYPYASKTDIDVDDAKIHNTLSDMQTQDAVSDQQIGKNGFAYGVTQVSAETKKIDFTLTHAMTYLRFVVASNDFADYMLNSVQLFDKAGEAVLAGSYTFDCSSCSIAAVAGKTTSSAKVSLKEDAEFTAVGTGTQELYLTVLPGADLTSSEVYAIVGFINAKKETVTIPVLLSRKGKLEAGTMVTIDLGSVNADNNAFAWYQPVEKRNLVDGWCYGAQNTYFVKRSTVADEWTSVTFEVKARGDFSQVAEPKYVGIMSSGDISNNGLIRLPDGTMVYNANPANLVGDNYEVTVQMAPTSKECGSSAYGVVSIYDKDYNLLWSYMINSYLDGEEPKANEYPGTGESVMDRNLGAKRPATKAVIPLKGTWGAYFQWGRPTPLMWSNGNQTHYAGKLVTEETDLKAALSKPNIKWGYANGDDWSSNGNWYVGPMKNLWGGNNSEDGYYDPASDMGKTVYDPCPAGYRVASGAVIDYAIKYGVRNEIDHTDVTATADILFPSVASVVVIPLAGGESDYWIYCGAHWGSNNQWGNRATSTNKAGALYWSNSPYKNQAYMLQHCYFSTGYGGAAGDPKVYTANKGQGLTVRCMVDKDNR